jgi:hypothetical protein
MTHPPPYHAAGAGALGLAARSTDRRAWLSDADRT